MRVGTKKDRCFASRLGQNGPITIYVENTLGQNGTWGTILTLKYKVPFCPRRYKTILPQSVRHCIKHS
jgi:hypothetical protein